MVDTFDTYHFDTYHSEPSMPVVNFLQLISKEVTTPLRYRLIDRCATQGIFDEHFHGMTEKGDVIVGSEVEQSCEQKETHMAS